MRRSGWNPARRNRNIGTAKSGHGRDNRMVIPASWADGRMFYSRLENPIPVEIQIGRQSITVLVEPCRLGFVHAVTVEDVAHLLHYLPSADIVPVKLVLLRQPKRKEKLLSSVWGRLAFLVEVGPWRGPAVILEAQPLDEADRWPGSRWPRSLGPDDMRELDRLRADGHQVRLGRRSYEITSDLAAIRSTQLYRTLPHEIGHYVDWVREVDRPAGDDLDEWFRLDELYYSRPAREREDFAHRYADDFRARAEDAGYLPFRRFFDLEWAVAQGLDPEWFGVVDSHG